MYGVIVTKSDGTKLEVHLDKNYHFLGTEAPDKDGRLGTEPHSRTGHSDRLPGSPSGIGRRSSIPKRRRRPHRPPPYSPPPDAPSRMQPWPTSFVWMS